MPLDDSPDWLALLDAPFPHPVPWGRRRIADPVLEARVATGFLTRQSFEASGYVFPDHPRPRVPRGLRPRYPELAAEDDARDAAEAEEREAAQAAEEREAPAAAAPEPLPRPAEPAPSFGSNYPGGRRAQRDGGPSPLPAPRNARATALARRDARRAVALMPPRPRPASEHQQR